MALENFAISRSIVKIRAVVPENAFTAGILGSERVGNGIVINSDGLILTIGYLITEATDVWLTVHEGRDIVGHFQEPVHTVLAATGSLAVSCRSESWFGKKLGSWQVAWRIPHIGRALIRGLSTGKGCVTLSAEG